MEVQYFLLVFAVVFVLRYLAGVFYAGTDETIPSTWGEFVSQILCFFCWVFVILALFPTGPLKMLFEALFGQVVPTGAGVYSLAHVVAWVVALIVVHLIRAKRA